MLAMNLEGKKEVFRPYLTESKGANFWLSVFTNLKNRGVENILFAAVDPPTSDSD